LTETARGAIVSDMDTSASEHDLDPESVIPLTEAVFHILLVLADHPCHGYGIMREVERLSEGQVTLGPGTLYRSLRRMLVDGLIEDLQEPAGAPAGDDRRRTYGLTPFGMAVARAEARRLTLLVETARTRGLLTRPWLGKSREAR